MKSELNSNLSMNNHLDRIDRELLAHLQKDARMSNKELAAAVSLAPSTCLQRVRRLRDTGVIRGAHAEVDPPCLGIALQAMVMVRLQNQSREVVESLHRSLLRRPEVLAIYEVAGRMDFHVHVGVRDTGHLRELTIDGLRSRPEVRQVETAVSFSHARSPVLPDYTEEAP